MAASGDSGLLEEGGRRGGLDDGGCTGSYETQLQEG